MKKLKATWTIDMKALEDANRGYEMTIESGGLYEVWLALDDHPKPAVVIGTPAAEVWEVLVDGQLITQRGGRIFRTGTAKPPPYALGEMQQMIMEQIAYAEDQKFLKLVSEMTKENL
jgi:hypothetical protein